MTSLGIVGSRSLAGNLQAYHAIHEYILAMNPDKIVSGGAGGIDSMSTEVALGLGYDEDDLIIHLPKPRSPARWDYIAALFVRNTLIVDDSDELLAIMARGGTKGTEDTLHKAEIKGITRYVIYID